MIDYVLDDWPERDATATISLRPPDGLALAAVLRGHAEKLEGSPTAFVLRSAHLPELSSGFPPETRLHVIAQQHNLEWVLDKNDALGRQTTQIRSLSAAVKSLPEVLAGRRRGRDTAACRTMAGFARPTLASTSPGRTSRIAIPRGTNSWSGSTDFGLFAGSHSGYSLIPASSGATGVWPPGCVSRMNRCRRAFRKALAEVFRPAQLRRLVA